MSYINDALKRAQIAKDERYQCYNDIVTVAVPLEGRAPAKRVFIFAAIAVIVTVGAFYAYDRIRVSGTSNSRPVKAAVATDFKPARSVKNINALYATALQLQKKGQLAEAEQIYQNILSVKNSHSGALNNLGVIYMQRDRLVDAMAMFNRAIAVKGANAEPYYNLACVHAQMNELNLSLEYLKKAIAVDPLVKNWAKEDEDLKNLKRLSNFKRLIK